MELPQTEGRGPAPEGALGRDRLGDCHSRTALVGGDCATRRARGTIRHPSIWHERRSDRHSDQCGICGRQAPRLRRADHYPPRSPVPAGQASATGARRGARRGVGHNRRPSSRPHHRWARQRKYRISLLDRSRRSQPELPKPYWALARSKVLPGRIWPGTGAARPDGWSGEGRVYSGTVASGECATGVFLTSQKSLFLVPGRRQDDPRLLLEPAHQTRRVSARWRAAVAPWAATRGCGSSATVRSGVDR